MGVLRLSVCVSGVSATFLLWAIAQERLSVPFPPKAHVIPHRDPFPDGTRYGDKFPSPLFLNFVQATASSLSALAYLLFSAWRDGSLRARTLSSIAGWSQLKSSIDRNRSNGVSQPETDKPVEKQKGQNRHVNGTAPSNQDMTAEIPKPWRKSLKGLLLQVALFQTIASPIGFLALEHISYPTMVLGKSCKLIPVLLLNVLLYRRKFSVHKYLVVALVTVGISLFMLLGEKKKKSGSDSLWGLSLLVINLFIDGLTNSTQDQIFSTYSRFTGQQMMFAMAVITQIILAPFLLIPLPTHPSSLLHHLPAPLSTRLRPAIPSAPITLSPPAALASIQFLISHPTALKPLLAYAILGGLGQLFIFETIQHFGSLTLVMVTVTRKLFTMLLSVVVFEHELTNPQWFGVAVVFGGIGVEAAFKRRDFMRRARRDRG